MFLHTDFLYVNHVSNFVFLRESCNGVLNNIVRNVMTNNTLIITENIFVDFQAILAINTK